MNSFAAFAMGAMNRNNELMVFDWNKAAEIIKEQKATYAFAYLDQDAEWTGGTIYEDDEIVRDSYTYLASTWATPMLIIDSDDPIPCYKMQHEVPDWGSDTKWPQSAIDILRNNEEAMKK